MAQIRLGLLVFYKGWKLFVGVPGIKPFIILPFLLSLLTMSVTLGWGFTQLSLWVGTVLGYFFTTTSGFLYNLLYYPLYILVGAGFIALVLLFSYLLLTVICSPFYSIATEKALMHLDVIADKPFQLGRWLALTVRMTLVSLVRALFFTVIALVLFVVSFIPGLNILAGYIACIIMAMDAFDYTLELAELNFRQRMAWFGRQRPMMAGMGLGLAVTLLFPGLTLILQPFVVLGSAQLYADRNQA